VVHRYLPIVRYKSGERTGITNLSPQGRNDVVPIIVVAPTQYVPKKATNKSPAVPAPALIANEIQAMLGNAPFYLDASSLPDGAGAHPIRHIAAACRAAGLSLIPTIPFASTQLYSVDCFAIANADGRGILLSMDVPSFMNIPNWIQNYPFAIAATDIMLDLGDNVANFAGLGNLAVQVFQQLHNANAWRSVALAGTSIPANFAGYPAGTYALPRLELQLWNNVRAANLPYRLDFADYATVSTAPPPTGIRWGFPINVKYSLPSDFLICRGVSPKGPNGVDMGIQLRGHAATIVNHPGRNRLAHCWADGQIDQIANGVASPQNLEHWVGLAINRHIEITRATVP
jgi:hypothetical protein